MGKNLNNILEKYQKKLENDFSSLTLEVKYNTFRYQRYLKYFLDSNISRDSNILEVGCYNGYGMELFKLFKYNKILGLDINDYAIELGKSRGSKITKLNVFEEVYLNCLNSKFDFIICNNMFHDDYEDLCEINKRFIIMFENFYRFIKKGGKVLFNFQKINGVLEDSIIDSIKIIGFLEIPVYYDDNLGRDIFFVLEKG